MQLELFSAVDRAPASRTPASFVTAVVAAAEATDPTTHAAAVEVALRIATPRIQRIARCYAAAWPDRAITADDLTQDVLLDVVAALPFAPRASDAACGAWLSALAFDTVHAAWRTAMQDAEGRAGVHAVFASDVGVGSPWPAPNDLHDDSDDAAGDGVSDDADDDAVSPQRRPPAAIAA